MEFKPTIAKLLKYIFGLALFSYSLIFSRDVFHKYQEKLTTLKSKSEKTVKVPTTVFCLDPSAKISVLNKLNLTQYSLYSIFTSNLRDLNSIGMSRSDFVYEAFYKLGEDFELYYEVEHDVEGVKILKLGENHVLSNHAGNHMIKVEKVLTILDGNCYKIDSSLSAEASILAKYTINFNKTISFEEIPSVKIYFTSEENAFGIITHLWQYGNELKFILRQNFNNMGSIQYLKLNAKKSTYLNDKATPCNDLANKCFTEELHKTNSNSCPKKCLPSALPLMNSVKEWKAIQECHSWEEFQCMANKIINLAYELSELNNTACPRYCNQVEYTGNVQADLNAYELSGVGWSYALSSITNVNEEYLVYDLASLVGSVGGTIGIFVGFSVFDLVGLIIDIIQAKLI